MDDLPEVIAALNEQGPSILGTAEMGSSAKGRDAACVRVAGRAPVEGVLEDAPVWAGFAMLADEVSLADAGVNAERTAWPVAVVMTDCRIGALRVMLEEDLRAAGMVAIHGRAVIGGRAQNSGDGGQGAFGQAWPPARDIELREPTARAGESQIVSYWHPCRGTLSLDHVLLSSASTTTLVLV
jgi:hypothetical protein